MAFKRTYPAVSRALAAATAVIVSTSVASCTPLLTGARDGTLSGTLTSERSRPSLGDILLEANGTYIGRILSDRDSTIERWPDRNGAPLRVWVDSSSKCTGAQAGFPAAVRDAFMQWSATGIPLRFAFVSDEDHADVKVRWTDHLAHKTGSTTWRTDRTGWLTGSEITLATHISDGEPLDARGMRAIALHEVGHALGLSHSDDGHDIMAPLVRVDGLSIPDRSTIKLLYSFQAGHIR